MNSLFIGLGGAGTNALGELQKKFDEYDRTSRNNNKSLNKFLYIDTDYSVKSKYPFIDIKGDFFPIGQGVIPDTVIRKIDADQNQQEPDVIRINEWIDKCNPALRAPHDLAKGAAGFRMLTRMAMWQRYGDLRRTLNGKLTIQNVGTVERIYVVSGTCGGTGCGCLIDLLFMLNELKLQNGQQNFPPVNLMLVMPQGYFESYDDGDNRKTDYALNAYGLFSELNAVLKDYWSNVSYKKDASGSYVDQNGNPTTDPSKYVAIPSMIAGKQWAKHSVKPLSQALISDLKFLPFNNAYMFDSHTEATTIDYDVISERIAKFIFNLEVGNTVQAGLDSVFSNVLIANRIASANQSFIKSFCATGSFTIQTHEELRKRYVREKFIYQMMAHGFVGMESDYPEPNNPDTSLWVDLNNQITNYTINAWTNLKALYQNAEEDTLISLLKNIENNSSTRDFSFTKTFPLLGTKSGIQRQFALLCDSIRESVLKRCGEWIVMYNLEYAKNQIDFEDTNSTRTYSSDIADLKKISVKSLFGVNLVTKKTLWKKLEDAFSKYINILVNRYLSDNGCFDEVRDLLDKISDSIDIENFETSPKRKLMRWERYFIKDLMNLKNDPTREFIGGTDSLFAGSKLSPKCDFPNRYAAIVHQTEDNLPDMEYIISQEGVFEAPEKSIPWYKERIMRDLQLEENFRPDNLKDDIGYIWERFYEKVQKLAVDIIDDPDNNLLEPIANKLSTQDKIASTAQSLYGAKKTFLTTDDGNINNHPFVSIYLGHFNGGAGAQLDQAIRRQPNFNQNENRIQDDPQGYWGDRYVKIFVNMNYSLDEYTFYDQYESLFKDYRDTNFKNWARHLPFSSIKFWECKDSNIVELFNKGSEETRVQQMREQLVWSESQQFYAFGFMMVLLSEYYNKLATLPNSKDFIAKFLPIVKGRRKIKPICVDSQNKVTLTYSSDFMFNPKRDEYRIDEADGITTVNLNLKNISGLVGDIKDRYNRYILYWIKVIQQALQQQTISNRQMIYSGAFNKIIEIARNRNEPGVFQRWAEPYYNAQNQQLGNRDFFEEYMLWFSN